MFDCYQQANNFRLLACLDPVKGDALLTVIKDAFLNWQQQLPVMPKLSRCATIALKAFENKNRNCLDFNEWYHGEICSALMHRIENNAGVLRLLFCDQTGYDFIGFNKQIKIAKQKGIEKGKPIVIIAKEPGENNHFIAIILDNDKLLVINPLGFSEKEIFYQALAALQQDGTIQHIYLSTNVLQKRKYEPLNLVSCGPIVLETVLYILSSYSEEQLQNLWEQFKAVDIDKHSTVEKLSYRKVKIDSLLNAELQALENYNEDSQEENYKNDVIALRKRHYDNLKKWVDIYPDESNWLQTTLEQEIFADLPTEENSVSYRMIPNEASSTIPNGTACHVCSNGLVEVIQSRSWLVTALSSYQDKKVWHNFSFAKTNSTSLFASQANAPISPQLRSISSALKESALLMALFLDLLEKGDRAAINYFMRTEVSLPLPIFTEDRKKIVNYVDSFLLLQARALTDLQQKLSLGRHDKRQLIQQFLDIINKKYESLKYTLIDDLQNCYNKKIFNELYEGSSAGETGASRFNELVKNATNILLDYKLAIENKSSIEDIKSNLQQKQQAHERIKGRYQSLGYPFVGDLVTEVLARRWSKEKIDLVFKQYQRNYLNRESFSPLLNNVSEEVYNNIINSSVPPEAKDEEGVPVLARLLTASQIGIFEHVNKYEEGKNNFINSVMAYLFTHKKWGWLAFILDKEVYFDKEEELIWQAYDSKLKENQRYIREKYLSKQQVDVIRERQNLEWGPDIDKRIMRAYVLACLDLIKKLINFYEEKEVIYWQGKLISKIKHPNYWQEAVKEAISEFGKELVCYYGEVLVLYSGKDYTLSNRIEELDIGIKKLQDDIELFNIKINAITTNRKAFQAAQKNKAKYLMEKEGKPLPWNIEVDEALIDSLGTLRLQFTIEELEHYYLTYCPEELRNQYGNSFHQLMAKEGCWDVLYAIWQKIDKEKISFKDIPASQALLDIEDDNKDNILTRLFRANSEDNIFHMLLYFILQSDVRGGQPYSLSKLLYQKIRKDRSLLVLPKNCEEINEPELIENYAIVIKIKKFNYNAILRVNFDDAKEPKQIDEDKIVVQYGYSHIELLSEQEKVPETIALDELILQKKGDLLTVYWSLDGKVVQKTFNEKEVNNNISSFASLDKSSNQYARLSKSSSLIQEVALKYGCSSKNLIVYWSTASKINRKILQGQEIEKIISKLPDVNNEIFNKELIKDILSLCDCDEKLKDGKDKVEIARKVNNKLGSPAIIDLHVLEEIIGPYPEEKIIINKKDIVEKIIKLCDWKVKEIELINYTDSKGQSLLYRTLKEEAKNWMLSCHPVHGLSKYLINHGTMMSLVTNTGDCPLLLLETLITQESGEIPDKLNSRTQFVKKFKDLLHESMRLTKEMTENTDRRLIVYQKQYNKSYFNQEIKNHLSQLKGYVDGLMLNINKASIPNKKPDANQGKAELITEYIEQMEYALYRVFHTGSDAHLMAVVFDYEKKQLPEINLGNGNQRIDGNFAEMLRNQFKQKEQDSQYMVTGFSRQIEKSYKKKAERAEIEKAEEIRKREEAQKKGEEAEQREAEATRQKEEEQKKREEAEQRAVREQEEKEEERRQKEEERRQKEEERRQKEEERRKKEEERRQKEEERRQKEEERKQRLRIERELIKSKLKIVFDKPLGNWDIYRVSREQDIDLLFNYKSVCRLGEKEKPPTSVEPNKMVLQLKDDNLTIYWSLDNSLMQKNYKKNAKNTIQNILTALPEEEESIQQDLVKKVLLLVTKPNAIVMIGDNQSYHVYFICEYQIYKDESESFPKVTMQVTPEEELLLSKKYAIKKIPFTPNNKNIYEAFVQKVVCLGSETLFPVANVNDSQYDFDEEPDEEDTSLSRGLSV